MGSTAYLDRRSVLLAQDACRPGPLTSARAVITAHFTSRRLCLRGQTTTLQLFAHHRRVHHSVVASSPSWLRLAAGPIRLDCRLIIRHNSRALVYAGVCSSAVAARQNGALKQGVDDVDGKHSACAATPTAPVVRRSMTAPTWPRVPASA
ncbi:uncharacterized protein BKA78DRAFT_87595 [Phyllosticta capitalensis]|uniref:uncharacterized protein n=1 Tax=Phyllosticta capitalensis TaxID=121624 RepID=UPI00312CE4F3